MPATAGSEAEDMITLLHGIGAYRGQRNPVALSRALTKALSGVELCASEKPIGAFGAVFFGQCRAIYPCDVYSWVDGVSKLRNFDTDQVQADPLSVDLTDQLAVESVMSTGRQGDYCEAFFTPSTLRAVWVKNWADANTMRAAEIIASRRGVPLLLLAPGARLPEIMDVLPTTVYTTTRKSA